MRNQTATRDLVEFLHAYLDFLVKFGNKIDINLNLAGLEFVSESLQDPRSQRDLLTQSTMIYWNFVKISKLGESFEPFELLIACLKTDDPLKLVLGDENATDKEIPITRGIV